MIKVLSIAFATFVAAFGLIGVTRPSCLLSLVSDVWRAPWGPYGVALVRLVFGVVLLLVAPDSRFPTTLGVFAALAIIGGLAASLCGRERALRFVAWWQRRRHTFVRAWAIAVVAFGAFVVYACL